MKNSMLYMFLFFVAIGIVSLVAGIRNYQKEEAFFASAEHDTATIQDFVPDPNPKVADFCPEYQFTTKAGETVNYVGDNCPSKPDYSMIGQHEEVYIDPAQPQIVESRGLTGSEGSGLILGIAGAIFFPLLGLGMYLGAVFSERKKARMAQGNATGSFVDAERQLAQLERQEQELKKQIRERGG